MLEGKVGPEVLVKEDLPQKGESWNDWHQTMMAGKCLWGQQEYKSGLMIRLIALIKINNNID